VKKTLCALMLIPLLCIWSPTARAFDLPDEALKLLAQASVDPCSICAKEKSKKAFALLEKVYAPGTVISTDANCRLVKPSSADELDLTITCYPSEVFMQQLSGEEAPPRLVFTFSTEAKHLVGIRPKDFTSDEIARSYAEAKPGTVFEGRLEVAAYKYGDGKGFNYFGERGRLQIHCRVLDLKPAGS
jgi:hypothetical protein